MLTLIQNGEIYQPERAGIQSILLCGEHILKIGQIAEAKLADLGLEYQVLDASGQLVVPGFIDPHEHIIGAGGEQGWASRTSELSLAEIVLAGITTVVGCLG